MGDRITKKEKREIGLKTIPAIMPVSVTLVAVTLSWKREEEEWREREINTSSFISEQFAKSTDPKCRHVVVKFVIAVINK